MGWMKSNRYCLPRDVFDVPPWNPCCTPTYLSSPLPACFLLRHIRGVLWRLFREMEAGRGARGGRGSCRRCYGGEEASTSATTVVKLASFGRYRVSPGDPLPASLTMRNHHLQACRRKSSLAGDDAVIRAEDIGCRI